MGALSYANELQVKFAYFPNIFILSIITKPDVNNKFSRRWINNQYLFFFGLWLADDKYFLFNCNLLFIFIPNSHVSLFCFLLASNDMVISR